MFAKAKSNRFTNRINLKICEKLFYKTNKKGLMDFDASKDYYKALGISSTANEKQIKEAYYKLAKKHHPDVNGGKTSEQFKEMSAAYDILSDAGKKKQYDEFRSMYSNENYSNDTSQSQGSTYSNPFGGSQNYEKFYRGSGNTSREGFNKQYNKTRTTYSYRDPKTGQYKSYTYEGDSQGNPFFKDFEDFMKKFNSNWQENQNKGDSFNNKFTSGSSGSDRFRDFRRNNNFSDPYSQFRNTANRQNNYNTNPKNDFHPNFNEYDYYNYLYAKRMFTYLAIGAMFLFFISIVRRRKAEYYIDDPNVFPYATYTPYPPHPMQHAQPQFYESPHGVVPPAYNSNNTNTTKPVYPNNTYPYPPVQGQMDPYTSPIQPRFK